MLRLPTVLAFAAATAAAQDHIIPMGFASGLGPASTTTDKNHPAARVKDNNLDGVINLPQELHTFLSTCFNTTTGTGKCFMTDVRTVLVDGEYEFYFTDSEQGRVVRGVDKNHNGLLDRGEDTNGNGVLNAGEDTNGNLVLDTEVTEFFFFGVTTPTFAPDTLDGYHDQGSNQTRIYVSIDSVIGAYARGIHKLVDLNADGDAKDLGEQSLFVNSTIPLTTPGIGGPLPNFWQQVRVLPGGKIIGYASGLAVPAAGPFSPNENAFYGFTDNGGATAATVELWFDCSQLNNLPDHPDFANNTFPVWDIDYLNGVTPTRRSFARWIAVAENGGFAGVTPAYYIASSYTWGLTQAPPSFGDINVNNQHVSGLIYRVDDVNNNQSIDAGELTLWANMSGATIAGVAPISFINLVSGLPVNTLVDRTWSVDATREGEFSFTYANGSGNDAVVKLYDASQDGVIDNTEIAMVFASGTVGGTYPPPFNPTMGPYFNPHAASEDGTVPGPFPVGIATSGKGCFQPTRGLDAVMDAWGGAPSVGNGAFALGPIRGVPFYPAILALGAGATPPVPLGGLGFPAGCTLDIAYLQIWGFTFADARGRAIFGLGIPVNNGLIGQIVSFQGAAYDPASPVALQWHTSNALVLTIQP